MKKNITNFEKAKAIGTDTLKGWVDHKAPKLAAALAYYTVFSLAPLLLIFIGIAGIVFKDDAARGKIISEISGLVGKQAASLAQSMIQSAGENHRGAIATVIGIGSMFFGASGVFGELQDSMNLIWQVDKDKNSGIWSYVKDRFLSFTMVLGVGFLLTVSLILSAVIGAVSNFFWNSSDLNFIWESLNFCVSFVSISFLFTLIFKFLPDQKLRWRDTWLGGVLTAFLFTIGKSLLGFYLGREGTSSGYGAAGSLILILIWVYYTSQILFVGAEFTRAYVQSQPPSKPRTTKSAQEINHAR